MHRVRPKGFYSTQRLEGLPYILYLEPESLVLPTRRIKQPHSFSEKWRAIAAPGSALIAEVELALRWATLASLPPSGCQLCSCSSRGYCGPQSTSSLGAVASSSWPLLEEQRWGSPSGASCWPFCMCFSFELLDSSAPTRLAAAYSRPQVHADAPGALSC